MLKNFIWLKYIIATLLLNILILTVVLIKQYQLTDNLINRSNH